MSQFPEATQQQTQDTARTMEVVIRLALIAALIIWCFKILQPFISTIVWAMIIAAALYPAYRGFSGILKRGNKTTATLFTLLILAVVLTPSFMLSDTLVSTARTYAEELKDGTLEIPPAPDSVRNWPFVGERVHSIWKESNENLGDVLERFEAQLRDGARWLLKTAAGAGLGILQFALAVIIAGVFLAYSEGGGEFARRLGRRLAGTEGEKYAALASNTVRSVAQGVLGVAVIQAILAGIGFMVAGIPGAGLWTLMVLILATIQIPTGLVLFPAIAWYASTADSLPAILFGIWMIAVGLSDNILKPLLLGRGSTQPMAVIFLGAIGGFLLSGIVGLFVGAVVLALGYDLFMLWLNQDVPPHLAPALEETQNHE